MTSLSRSQKRADERDDAERAINAEAEMLALRRKAAAWGAREDQESITSFTGRWEALSNWFPAPVMHRGVRYASVEHAFQAIKASDDASVAEAIRTAPTAAAAHTLGQKVKLPPSWERTKLELMETLLRDKFRRDAALRERLLRTDRMNLIASNDWGELFWGVSGGKGSNALGKALMKLREEARSGSDIDAWLASSFELAGPFDPCDGLSLEVHKGGVAVETLKLGASRPLFLAGKHSACDVPLEHPSVSRRHAALVRDKSRGLLLIDLASKAGTTLNGRRVPPCTAVPLKQGAKIVFGGSSRSYVAKVDKIDSLKVLAEQHAKLQLQLSQLEKDASDKASLFGLLPSHKRGPDPTATSAFVGNLPFDVTEEELQAFFEEATGARVLSVRLPKNKATGEPSGIGFVEFESAAGVAAALEHSGDELHGRTIKVDVAEAKRKVERPCALAAAVDVAAQAPRRPPPPPKPRSPPARSDRSPRRRDTERDDEGRRSRGGRRDTSRERDRGSRHGESVDRGRGDHGGARRRRRRDRSRSASDGGSDHGRRRRRDATRDASSDDELDRRRARDSERWRGDGRGRSPKRAHSGGRRTRSSASRGTSPTGVSGDADVTDMGKGRRSVYATGSDGEQ